MGARNHPFLGPCDHNDHCPDGLWCLRGDCWPIPDKPIKMDELIKKESIPSSFPIESSEQTRSEIESEMYKELEEDENDNTHGQPQPRAIILNGDSGDRNFDDGQLVVPLALLTTRSPRARSRFHHDTDVDHKMDGFITARTSTTTTSAPVAPSSQQQQPLKQASNSPPGFTPSSLIEMEQQPVKGRSEPDLDFPIRAAGVRLAHPDLLASRSIAPLHPALFLPPPSKTTEEATSTPKKAGLKQIELPQEKAVHFDAKEIARRRKELKRRLDRKKQKQVQEESEPLDPIEFPISSMQHKVVDNEAREGEDEERLTLPTPSVLGDDYTDDGFMKQFEEQKKQLESSTLGPFRRRTAALSNSIERSGERDAPSGESRRITPESLENPEKNEFHPRKASVPPLSTLATVDTDLPVTSSPLGRILSLEERRISKAQADFDQEIREALKTRSVDDVLREQIRRINGESDERRSSTLTFTPSPTFSALQTSPRFERTTIASNREITDPAPFVTPGRPFEDADNVWSPMNERTTVKTLLRDFRRSDPRARLIFEYTSENIRHRPVRVEMDRAVDSMRDECSDDSQCGPRLKCCRKKWCDRSHNCGAGLFCLPTCEMTKMTHLGRGDSRESLIDIIYD